MSFSGFLLTIITYKIVNCLYIDMYLTFKLRKTLKQIVVKVIRMFAIIFKTERFF